MKKKVNLEKSLNYFFKNIVLFFLLLLAALLLLFKVNKPFVGHHDWNSVFYSQGARNHLKYGLWETKLGMVPAAGLTKGDTLSFFTHHPPLIPVFISFFFFLFGIKEWAARLVPIISSLLMVFYLYRLVNEGWGKKQAFFTCLFLIFSPMFIYFGKLPVNETVVAGMLLFSFYHYWRWFKNNSDRDFLKMLVGLVFGMLTSWAGYYLPVYLVFHTLIFKKEKKKRNKILFLLPLSLMFFIGHFLYIYFLTGKFFSGGILETFLSRFNIGERAAIHAFTYREFLIKEARWLVVYFTRVQVILSSLWLLNFGWRALKRKKIERQESFVLVLLFFGFTHVVIFRNLAFIHDYMLYYASPFFAVSAGLLLFQLTKRLRGNFLSLIFSVLVFYFFITERIPFTKTLLATEMNNPGRRVGLLLNQLVNEKERVLVNSRDFGSFFDVFVGFYADRKINYRDFNLESFKQDEVEIRRKYHYFIVVRSHDYLPQELKDYLGESYENFSQDGLVFYNLKEKKE